MLLKIVAACVPYVNASLHTELKYLFKNGLTTRKKNQKATPTTRVFLEQIQTIHAKYIPGTTAKSSCRASVESKALSQHVVKI